MGAMGSQVDKYESYSEEFNPADVVGRPTPDQPGSEKSKLSTISAGLGRRSADISPEQSQTQFQTPSVPLNRPLAKSVRSDKSLAEGIKGTTGPLRQSQQ